MRCLSLPYQLVTAVRNRCYDWGVFAVHQARLPVVSVGNIAMGGTGKTPLIIKLAEELGEVTVLTRGYGSQGEHLPPHELRGIEDGDEPALIAQRTGARVIVGKDRVAGADLATGIILLDDGMQHRGLHRDWELVVVDGSNPFGGWQREFPSALARADLVVVTHADCPEVSRYTTAPIVRMQHTPRPVSLPPKVGLFCAIGKPNHFVKSVSVEVVEQLTGPDHAPFPVEQLQALSKRAEAHGAGALVCTEKDAVKLPADLPVDLLPIIPIPIDLEILSGKESWDQFINSIKSRV